MSFRQSLPRLPRALYSTASTATPSTVTPGSRRRLLVEKKNDDASAAPSSPLPDTDTNTTPGSATGPRAPPKSSKTASVESPPEAPAKPLLYFWETLDEANATSFAERLRNVFVRYSREMAPKTLGSLTTPGDPMPLDRLSTPAAIVDDLDRDIVGQSDAKRAVAVALRNRWRRHHLPKRMRDAVVPKNILMIGGTGVGKTEIARRLADNAAAPFVKVEATRFSSGRSRSYVPHNSDYTRHLNAGESTPESRPHPSDVDSIVQDLMDVSVFESSRRLGAVLHQCLMAGVEEHIIEHVRNSHQDAGRSDEQLRKAVASGDFADHRLVVSLPPASDAAAAPYTETLVPTPSSSSYVFDHSFSTHSRFSSVSPFTPTPTTATPTSSNSPNSSSSPDPSGNSKWPVVVSSSLRSSLRSVANHVIDVVRPHTDDPESPASSSTTLPDLTQSVRLSIRVATLYQILDSLQPKDLVPTQLLHDKALQAVEEDGIVFIEEIDKICSDSPNDRNNWTNTLLQRHLLPLLEGTRVHTSYGPVRTDHILFIASGAFTLCQPSDLLPELQGRLPIRVKLQPLSQNDLARLLKQPRNLIEQQVALFATEGVQLAFSPDAIDEIARIAYEVNASVEDIGARRLVTILERVIEDLSFRAPALRATSIVVDKQTVHASVDDALLRTEVSKFVL